MSETRIRGDHDVVQATSLPGPSGLHSTIEFTNLAIVSWFANSSHDDILLSSIFCHFVVRSSNQKRFD